MHLLQHAFLPAAKAWPSHLKMVGSSLNSTPVMELRRLTMAETKSFTCAGHRVAGRSLSLMMHSTPQCIASQHSMCIAAQHGQHSTAQRTRHGNRHAQLRAQPRALA